MGNTSQLLHQALALHRQGNATAAEAVYRQVLTVDPNNADAGANFGLLLAQSGRFSEAFERLDPVSARNEDHSFLNYVLGRLCRGIKDYDKAKDYLTRSLLVRPEFAAGLAELGMVHYEQGTYAESLEFLMRALSLNPSAHLHTNLGNVYVAMNDKQNAVCAYQRALALEPDYQAAKSNLSGLCPVPQWHFDMLSDHQRNDAFETVINRHISEHTDVLDIGTGSGLLAMMAARAGARSVMACEVDPVMAACAERVIASNAFEKTITVVNKRSTQLQIGVDLPEPADVILAEVLDPIVIGEGVLTTLRHATSQLLKPGGLVIPGRATLYGALMELPRLRSVNPVCFVNGFDLSDFDGFRDPAAGIGVRLDCETHRVLSQSFVIEEFVFAQLHTLSHSVTHSIPVSATSTGIVHALVCWFELWLDESTKLSSRSQSGRSHWEQAAFFLNEDLPVSKDQRLNLQLWRDDSRYRLESLTKLSC